MTAFTIKDVEAIYTPYLKREISLAKLWDFSRDLTNRYHDEGYFLCVSYVPPQTIEDGTIILHVVEGSISDVVIEGAHADSYLIKSLRDMIVQSQPTRVQDLEEALLLFNNLPGMSFESVLEKADIQTDLQRSARLILKEIAEPARASVAFNNYGSRFTGIERTSFAYETSVLPFQNSMISGFANFPNGNNLWSLNLEHDIRVAPRFNLKVAAAKTASQPGFTLAVNEIKSTAVKFNTEIGWQALQRRSHKATFFAGLDMLNSSVDVLGSVLTRDRIRKAYIKADYNGQGFMGGHDYFSLNFSHGLKALGSNDNGDLNLSRAAAKPDFSKLEATWQHQRMLTPDLLFNSVLIGQRASKALYSSEEFGFGGEQNARAYDSAEITGDHGLGATLELHYTSLPDKYGLTLRPFAFYDIGKIWNIDNGQPDGLSIADIGAGINISHTSGLVGKLTIAQPLSKTIDTPAYGRNGHNPRLYFQIKHNF